MIYCAITPGSPVIILVLKLKAVCRLLLKESEVVFCKLHILARHACVLCVCAHVRVCVAVGVREQTPESHY